MTCKHPRLDIRKIRDLGMFGCDYAVACEDCGRTEWLTYIMKGTAEYEFRRQAQALEVDA